MNKPLISVALTTYNGEKYLSEQLESIINQDYKNFEIIISDDNSKDKTIEIINDYKHKYSNIIVNFNSENLGFKKNFEKAMSLCNGEFIAFSDQDDIWTSNHLSILFENIGKKDISCSNSLLVDESGLSKNVFMNEIVHFKKFPQSNSDLFTYLLFGNNFVQGSTCLLRADFAKKNLPIPDFIDYHDHWFALNASLNNGIAYTTESTLFYRQHESNVTTNTKSIIKNILFVLKNRKKFLGGYKKILEQCEHFRKNADTTLTTEIDLIEEFYTATIKRHFFTYSKLFVKHYKLFFNQDNYKMFWLRFIRRIMF